jgi:hydroxyacylglutathione hydrolase
MRGSKQEAVIPIPLGFTTSFLLTGSRYVLVDSGNPGSAAKILQQLASRGIQPEQVSLIVVTHGHQDHTGDLQILKEKTGATVAAHQDEVEALRRGANLHLKPTGLSGRFFKMFASEKEKGQSIEPDILVNKELDLKPYGVKGKIISTPGHTPGSLSVLLAGGDAVIGDLLMGGMLLRRRPRYPYFAHDMKRLERSIKMVLKLKPGLLYTSHGGPLKPENVSDKLIKKKEAVKKPKAEKKKSK